MFLLINNEELHKQNKRIIFNITNDGDVNMLMRNAVKGDVIELELTEIATNTLHYVLASYKTLVKDVPYAFEFSPYLGVNTLSGTKNLIDFKLNRVIVKLEHDRYAPSLDHYVIGTDDDQNGLVDIEGVQSVELRPLRPEKKDPYTSYRSDRKPLHKHDCPAEYHNAPHLAYPNYDTLPQYQHCLAKHHHNIKKPKPAKVVRLSREAHAQILRMLGEFRYMLPSGGCVLPIIDPELLVSKDYLVEYVKHELSNLVTLDILSSRVESALKESMILKKVADVVYGLVLDKIEEEGIEIKPKDDDVTDPEDPTDDPENPTDNPGGSEDIGEEDEDPTPPEPEKPYEAPKVEVFTSDTTEFKVGSNVEFEMVYEIKNFENVNKDTITAYLIKENE